MQHTSAPSGLRGLAGALALARVLLRLSWRGVWWTARAECAAPSGARRGFGAPWWASRGGGRRPNQALQRTGGWRRGVTHGVLARPSLSLGSLGGTGSHRTMTPQRFSPSVRPERERVADSHGLSFVAGWRESSAMVSTSVSSRAQSFVSRGRGAAPNHALQRTRPSRYCCNRGVSWAGSLSLGR